MNNKMPHLVIELHRYKKPDSFGFHKLTPVDADWNLYPFGGPQRYSRVTKRLSPEDATVTRSKMLTAGYQPVGWDQLPEDLRLYLIRQEVPLGWKRSLAVDDPKVTELISVWIQGDWPVGGQ